MLVTTVCRKIILDVCPVLFYCRTIFLQLRLWSTDRWTYMFASGLHTHPKQIARQISRPAKARARFAAS